MPRRHFAQIDAEQVELVIEFGHLCGEGVPQHALECTGIAVLCTQDRQFPPEAGALLGEFRIDILDDLKSTGDHAVFHLEDKGQRLIYNVQNAEQDKELEEHRQAGSTGVDVFLLIQFHLFFLHLLGVVLILFPQLFQLRIEPLHFCGIFLLLIRNGKQDQLGEDREQQDRQSIVVYQVVDQTHDPAERLSAQII